MKIDKEKANRAIDAYLAELRDPNKMCSQVMSLYHIKFILEEHGVIPNARDLDLEIAGWHVLRLTWRQVVDEPERVVLETTAPERGFLFLADVYFPGWSATVNGQPVPILAANHAFRLVEVPAGPVTLEFRYRSRWVWIGAVVSGATLLVVVGVLIVGVRAPRLRCQ